MTENQINADLQESSVPCIQLKSQSIRLQFNMQRHEIDCLASYELTIGYSASSKQIIDLKKQMEFQLFSKQSEIKDIIFIPPDVCPEAIRLTKQKYHANRDQANQLSSIKVFKAPCSYMALNHGLNKIQDDWQQINLIFNFEPEKLISQDYEYLKSLEETVLMKVQIHYIIQQPISGIRFIQSMDKKFAITEKCMHNSRNWVPTPYQKQQKYPPYCHEEKDLLHYSKLIIVVPQNYQAIATGQLIEINEIEDYNQIAYNFEINEYISPDDIGIFVGEFEQSAAIYDEFKLNIFSFVDKRAYLFETDQIKKIFENVDRYWFKDPLLQKTRETLQIGSGPYFFNRLNVLILPQVYKFGYFSFYPFRNILVFDESQIPEQIPCKHTQDEFYRILTLQLNSLCLKLFLAPSKDCSDKWIELGFAFQSTWLEDYAQLHEKLLEQIKRGQDVRLDQTHFQQRFQVESLEYQLKTRMVITIMARMTNQPDVFIKETIKRFYQDLKGTIPCPLSTEKIFATMKRVFSVSKGKIFLKMFIKSAGAWHFKVSYDYERDHKLNLNITQSPLIGHWVHIYTQNYVQGSKALDHKSDIINQYLQYQEKLKLSQKQVLKQFKEFEDQQKEQPYDQSKKQHSMSTIKDFKRRDYQIQASGLIPEELVMPLFYQGPIRILVSETNELKLETQDREVIIPNKFWSKHDINCTQKLKKYNIPKRHLEINAQAYFQEDPSGKIELENENNNQVKTPMIHGILGEAILKSGVNINTGSDQTIKSYSEEIQREPPQWIKWDPIGLTIKEVEYQIQKELVVMCQVLKEKDMDQIACVLRNIKKLEIRERVVRTIVLIIENSYAHLESSVIVKLLQLLREMVNKSSTKRLEENADFEDMVELQAYLKLAEKITYRYFFNQNDNSLKYLKFNNFDEYDVILALFKNLRRLNTASTLGFHNELIGLFVTILEGYDNSQNQYDCNYLISKLIKLLLCTNCNHQKFHIMKALKHELKKVVFLTTQKNYILKVIIIHYKKFIDNNFSKSLEPTLAQIYKQYDEQLISILKHHQVNVIQSIENAYLERAYYKKQLMEQYEKNKKEPYIFVYEQLYFLSKKRTNNSWNSLQFNNYLQILQIFMAKHYQKFAHELSRGDIDPNLAKGLSQTIFECIIQGPALLNYNVQNNFASIYKILYYYFAPLQGEEIHQNVKQLSYTLTNFTPDQNWCNGHFVQLQDEIKELKLRTNGQQIKKNRPPSRITNQDLSQQLERFASKNSYKLQERDITKLILKYLANLPQIRQLEDREGIEQSPQSKKIYKIDQVRASMKRKNQAMNTIQDNVLSMIENYFKKQQLTKIEYDEYCQLVRNSFEDGKRIMENYTPSKMERRISKMVIKSSILESTQFDIKQETLD